MADADDGVHDRETTAAVVRGGAARRGVRGFLHFLPLFFYLLVAYILIEVAVRDVRAVLFNVGGYKLTWVEVLYMVASFMAMAELLRVSEPGVDNTKEALTMLAAWVLYFLLFILGATESVLFWKNVRFGIFSNTEFVMLLMLSGVQVVVAFILNSRTLKRQIADARFA